MPEKVEPVKQELSAKDALALIRQFENKKDVAAKAAKPFNADGWLNLAFYLNEQYVEFSTAQESRNVVLREIPRDDNDVPRPVVNKIMHLINQQQAVVMQAKPVPEVLPASEDIIDAGNAQVSQAFLNYVNSAEVTDFETVLYEAVLWALVHGNGWLKWIFNPQTGLPEAVAPSPFDIFVDPYAKTFKKARYVIHTQFMDREQVYDTYGKEVQSNATERPDKFQQKLLEGMGATPLIDGVVVNEYWERPSRRYPKGRYAVWAGNTLLVAPTDFPYNHKQLPFTLLGSIPRPGSLWYASVIKWLRAPQMELNQFHAQTIMIRKAFANPKWWIDDEIELKEMPNSKPNQILRGHSTTGLKPEIIMPTVIPALEGMGDWLVEEMMNVAGQHEVSQGQVPGRVEAAKAIELLRESDTSRLSVLTNSIQSALAVGFWQELMLAKQFVPNEVICRSYSREGLPQVHRWRKDMVDPGMKLRITMGTGLASTRSSRIQEATELWQQGIIRDPVQIAEMIELPLPSFNPELAMDRQLADNENLQMINGTVVDAHSWDNHAEHIKRHNSFRKTQEYLTSDEETQKKFEYHVQQHKQLQVRELQEQVAIQQLMMQATGQAPPAEAEQSTEQTPPAEAGTM